MTSRPTWLEVVGMPEGFRLARTGQSSEKAASIYQHSDDESGTRRVTTEHSKKAPVG